MRSRNHSLPIIFLCAVLASLLLLAACGQGPQGAATIESAPTVASAGEATPSGVVAPTLPPAGGEAYPPATAMVETVNPYPGEGEAALPATSTPGAYPPAAETFQEPRFRIDQPVSVSATTITGQAPPNLALAVQDVTFNGTLLGTGRSDESGRFTIPVSGLIEGNRIGLSIAELAEGQTLNQMAEQYFPNRGEGFMNLPNVGIFFDTVLVQP
jgi:hypothetical protein